MQLLRYFIDQQIVDLQETRETKNVDDNKEIEDQNQYNGQVEKDNQIQALIEENDNLQQELEQVNQQYNLLESKYNEEVEANDNMQAQSVEQIQKLGLEKEALFQENTELKNEIAALKQSLAQPSEHDNLQSELEKMRTELKQMEGLYDTTLKELNDLKTEKALQIEMSSEPVTTSPAKLLIGDVDISHFSLAELQSLYLSEHNQLDLYTSYFQQLNDIMDETLSKYSHSIKMQEDIATHDKLHYFIEVMTSQRRATASDAELLRECDEWRVKAEENHAKLLDLQHESTYLQSCVTCCEQYLDRLVGFEKTDESNRLISINNRFSVACHRSQKLIKEYNNLKSHVEILKNELRMVRQGSGENESRLMQGVQLLAEHMGVLPPNCQPNMSVIESALQRIDRMVVEQLPFYAKKLEEFKRMCDNEHRIRKQLEERLHFYERPAYHVCLTNIQHNNLLNFRIGFTNCLVG